MAKTAKKKQDHTISLKYVLTSVGRPMQGQLRLGGFIDGKAGYSR
jgi:hypothetical protein